MSVHACSTPWTIPANLAVAVNGHLDYALVEAQVGFGDGPRGRLRGRVFCRRTKGAQVGSK